MQYNGITNNAATELDKHLSGVIFFFNVIIWLCNRFGYVYSIGLGTINVC